MNNRKYDIITCHPGKHHFFEQAYVLSKEFDLKFLTAVFFDQKYVNFIGKISPGLGSYLSKRSHPALSEKFVCSYPKIELGMLWSKLLKKEISYFTSNQRFGQWVIKTYLPPKIFIGVDTASLPIFKKWKNKSFLILDLVIALPTYRQKIYNAALSSNPSQNTTNFHFPGQWELEVYKEEVELADLILCGSEFVKESCLDYGVPEAKLKVIEYGVDLDLFKRSTVINKSKDLFKLAFVGNLSIRKGALLLKKLMQVIKPKFPDIELHVFGKVADDFDIQDMPGTTFHGFLPQDVMKRKLEMCHLMVFPTYFEGSAYSVYQSMSLGLPIITTKNCGSVVDETCGIIIPVNSVEAIEGAVIKLYKDAMLCSQMGEAAIIRAQQYSWSNYGDKLTAVIYNLKLI